MNHPRRALIETGLATAALLLVATFTACERDTVPLEDPGADAEARALERARKTADALTVELAGKLSQELQSGGPAAAIRVCSEVAQDVAASLSREGLAVSRVSSRWRNPADQPDEFERTHLERWEEGLRSGEAASELVEVVGEDGDRALRYLRPIFISDVCLKCHGVRSALASEVQELLDEKYPEDKAVGYGLADLRGAVSVRVALNGG